MVVAVGQDIRRVFCGRVVQPRQGEGGPKWRLLLDDKFGAIRFHFQEATDDKRSELLHDCRLLNKGSTMGGREGGRSKQQGLSLGGFRLLPVYMMSSFLSLLRAGANEMESIHLSIYLFLSLCMALALDLFFHIYLFLSRIGSLFTCLS